jgi:hypothetical protein
MKRRTDKKDLIERIKRFTTAAARDGSSLQARLETVRWESLTEYDLYTVLAVVGKLRNSGQEN